MAEEEGVEPPQAFTSASFRNWSLRPLGYSSVCLTIIHNSPEKIELFFHNMRKKNQISS